MKKQVPKPGPQDYVKYCPNCKGDLKTTKSIKKSAKESHRYKCDTCNRTFEINELDE
jgi:transposase-like protein